MTPASVETSARRSGSPSARRTDVVESLPPANPRRRDGRRASRHLPLPDRLAREQKIGDLLATLAGQPAETGG